jgi:formylglycine-generating enzyme required for sulfatase activity
MLEIEEERQGIPAQVGDAVIDAGYEPYFDDPLRPWGGNSVTALVTDLRKSQVVIVDLTEFDPYVMYGLGIAMTLRERVLLLFQGAANELPVLLSNEYCIFYRNDATGSRRLRSQLKEAIQRNANLRLDEYCNLVQQALPDLRNALRDPAQLVTSSDSVDNILREQRQMRNELIQLIEQLRVQLGVLNQPVEQLKSAISWFKQPKNIDKTLQQFNDLRTRLSEMIAKYSEAETQIARAEDYLARLARDRDAVVQQIRIVARTLEAERTLISSPHDEALQVFVPAALIVLGPPRDTEAERLQAERFVKAFYMDVTPVTNAQFARFVQATGYQTVLERSAEPQKWTWRQPEGPGSSIEGREDHPVVWVYREDALAYATWAKRRLPTRLEWERAMRGVTGRTWPWGEQFDPARCNLAGTGTTPVAAYPAGESPAGCLDMIGNVWEWLADELAGGRLTLMGGSWRESLDKFKVGYKQLIVPSDGTDDATGFRCAMDVLDSRQTDSR